MKRILVTGGTGFLGKNVVKLLKTKKFDVYSCSRKEGTDILDYKSFKEFVKKIKPEVLIHCAAHVGGIAYNALHPVEVFEDNVGIGLNVVKVCNEVGVNHVINIMPNCVYPGHLTEYEESKQSQMTGEEYDRIVEIKKILNNCLSKLIRLCKTLHTAFETIN